MESPFSDINFLPVLTAAVVSFALGMIWYSPFIFGKIWLEEMKLKEEDCKGRNKLIALVGAFFLNLVAAFILSSFVEIAGAQGAISGGIIGILAGVGFVVTSIATHYLFEPKPMKLFLIIAGQRTACYAAMGTILGIMS